MVSSLCERQASKGNPWPPQTTLGAQQQSYLRFICEIPKCTETALLKHALRGKALSSSLGNSDFAGDVWV